MGNVVREIIPTQRLPTNRVIIQRTMRMSKRNRTTVNEFSLKLYEAILQIWQKANIPTVNKKNCVKRLTTLLSSWSKQDCCKLGPGSVNEIKYEGMLDSFLNMTYSDPRLFRRGILTNRMLREFTCDQ